VGERPGGGNDYPCPSPTRVPPLVMFQLKDVKLAI